MIFDVNWQEIAEEQFREQIGEKKIIVFGASQRNMEIYRHVPMENIRCIYDNNETKWGSVIDGIEIKGPQCSEGEILITAVEDYMNIVPQIAKLGFCSVYYFMRNEIYESTYNEYLNFYRDSRTEYRWNVPLDQVKYIHVFPDDKFFLPIIDMLEKGFDMKEHAFLIYKINFDNRNNKYGTWEKYKELSKIYHNVLVIEDGLIIPGILNAGCVLETSIPYIKNSKIIIFHGEWMTETIRRFFVRDEMICQVKDKGAWLIWSGNAGRDVNNKEYVETLLKYCKVLMCKRVGDLYQKLCENVVMPKHYWYDKGANYAWILDLPEKRLQQRNVLLGQSCYPHNKNLETLQVLKRFSGDIDVYCITSYGAPDYISEVIEEGKKIFGNRFHAVDRFMPYKEYVDFLNTMDVAVYGMERAGSYDTLRVLFWLKKKVYLKKDSPIDMMTRDDKFHAYDFYQISGETIDEFFADEYAEQNYEFSLDEFDGKKHIERWRGLFELDMDNLP